MLARPHLRHALLIAIAVALLLALAQVARIERESQAVIWDSWWWLDGR